MKVLLCTPYIQSKEYAQGGVVVWGANIVNYYRNIGHADVELIPISFDRRTYSANHTSKLGAILNGIKELWNATFATICVIRKNRVDAVHICSSLGNSVLKDYIILFAAKKYGVRGYVHFHCGRVPIILKNTDKEHSRFLTNLSLASKGITMDLRSYNALRDYGIYNVVNLPNPLSLSIIKQVNDKRSAINKIAGRITFVGHVIRTKGIYELIESCYKMGTINLRIIGKVLPTDKSEIDSFLIKYKTDGSWITWTGEIPHEKVIEELLATEIFVFPSYTEGFPNVILEAMACGCAIVTTMVGAIPEMLDIDGDACGICVEPQDMNAIYNALRKVVDNPDIINQYSRKAVDRVNRLYTIDRVWEQMVDIWKS